jgi:cytochrome c553
MTSLSKCTLLSCTIAICAMAYPLDAVAQSPAAPAVVAVCAPCHGLDGIGREVEVPNIAGQHSIYLREQLLAFKGNRRKHPEMYFVGRYLSDQEIDQLVLYFSTLPAR